jgi:hypothetical protein
MRALWPSLLLVAAACRAAADRAQDGASRASPAAAATDSAVLAYRCATRDSAGRCQLWDPSLLELIVRPEVYDGRPVRTIGFVHFEFEGNLLYVSEADWRHRVTKNGIWIDPPAGFQADSAASRRQTNDRYVLVEGVFDARSRGHLGMSSGSIHTVTRLDPW